MEPRTAAQRQEDLDAFLTSVESKLRGPFSSLDLAKAITTTALRGSLSPSEYLQMIAQVLSRTEKVIQLRVLIALLGLDPSSSTSSSSNDEDMDDQIYQLLTQAQESPAYEEWVRTVAGLVRGIMFTEASAGTNNDDNPNNEHDEHDSPCRGEEAQSVLDKTCQEILRNVQELEQSTRRKVDDEKASSLWIADREPMFAPYRYSLVSPDLLDQVIPECNGTTIHAHFQVNREASILSKDLEIETQKAQEESKALMARSASTSSTTASSSTDFSAPPKISGNDTVAFPGFRTSASNGGAGAKSKAPPAKSSMFLPTKRPGVGGTVARAMPGKATIHARKAGAAQALVAKTRRPGMMNAGGTSTAATASNNKNPVTNTATGGGGSLSSSLAGRSRVATQSQNRSKMKIIDVKEVEGLNKEQEEREKTETKEQKLTARKRKIMEAAAEKGLVTAGVGKKAKANGDKNQTAPSSTVATSKKQAPPTNTKIPPKQQHPSQSNPTAATPAVNVDAAGGALAQAALLAYQQKVSDGQVTVAATPQVAKPPAAAIATLTSPQGHTITTTTAPTNAIPPDLRGLLDRANKLAPEDRLRVEQFFKERFNPTPGVMVYRMKLHENRTTDPESGQAVKETFYLELDYDTFETKQLRKVKRK